MELLKVFLERLKLEVISAHVEEFLTRRIFYLFREGNYINIAWKSFKRISMWAFEVLEELLNIILIICSLISNQSVISKRAVVDNV